MRGGCAALFMRLPKQSCRKRGERPLKDNYALLGALEHLHRLVLANLLDELLEAVLAKLLRNGVGTTGDSSRKEL